MKFANKAMALPIGVAGKFFLGSTTQTHTTYGDFLLGGKKLIGFQPGH